MSDLNLIAARYVEALFALAVEKKAEDAVKKDMLTLKTAFGESEGLRRFVTNPVI